MNINDIKGRIASYIKDVMSEGRKVVWPGRAYIIAATIIVFVIVFLVAMFVMAVDFSFAKLFGYLNNTRMR